MFGGGDHGGYVGVRNKTALSIQVHDFDHEAEAKTNPNDEPWEKKWECVPDDDIDSHGRFGKSTESNTVIRVKGIADGAVFQISRYQYEATC